MFDITEHGGGPNQYYTLRLENERYRVRIFYHDTDFYKLRDERKLDYEAILVSIRYKQNPLPFDIMVDPKDITRTLISLSDNVLTYSDLSTLQADIPEAKKLIREIYKVIREHF
ncbi:MAG: hypothetical protein LUF27_14440 [Lachnospiraceae bacterium]|nr:hypothetical protein [Lachnospiraceae bacterium]